MSEPGRTAIAAFHKDGRGHLTMIALTVIGGGKYPNTLTFYDVDYSRDRGCHLYHMSGAGGTGLPEVSGIYAISGEPAEVNESPCNLVDEASRIRNATHRLTSIPPQFRLEKGWDFLDWLGQNGIHGDAIWCAKHRDFLHEDSPCEHIWWCNRTGTWSTPDDRCECKDREECRD